MNVLFSSPDTSQPSQPMPHPLHVLPEPSLEGHALLAKGELACPVPSDEECFALWDKYAMIENVRAHSLTVARIATALATRASQLQLPVHVQAVRAAALLHDLAKTYCLKHGGSHATLGAGWVLQETGNPLIAQGVFCHVHWPWPLPLEDAARMCTLPFFVIYADKRSMHNMCVPLKTRFDDLICRYGKSETAQRNITFSYNQAVLMERALEAHLGCQLYENTFDSGWMVHGA